MGTIYRILFNEDGIFGVAYTIARSELFCLPHAGSVEGWQPLSLELREGEFADYLSSNLGCRLCSQKLKNILQDHASPDDELQWLEVEIHRGSERRSYSILHFPDPPDVLNSEKSIFARGDFVVKPVLSKPAIGNHHVFSFPRGGELPMFVTDKVKRAIEAAGSTGLEFSRTPVQ